MSKLSVAERKQLHRALVAAFPTWNDLDEALQLNLGENLNNIAAPAPMPTVVLRLIVWAEARWRLPEVIEAVREARPQNGDLQALAAARGPMAGPSLSDPATAKQCEAFVERAEFTDTAELRARAAAGPAALTTSEATARELLERKVLQTVSFFGTEQWRADMAARERAVCLIEFPAGEGQGTGFLIGPDAVMTNFHVLEEFIAKGRDPSQIHCRFDFKAAADGVTLAGGLAVGLAADWLVRSSAIDDLDYAIVRLSEPAGRQAIAMPGGGSRVRGWLTPTVHPFERGESIFIIQHPRAAPLKVASGGLVKAQQRRVYYLANTLDGSSGSPCFTSDWEFVALHRANDSVGNIGVPCTAILNDIPVADREALFPLV